MRTKLVTFSRSLSAFALMIGMLFSVFAPTVAATTENLAVAAENSSNVDAAVQISGAEKPLVYVSIGDSMTNGYGLEGYDGVSGLVNYGVNTYANQFAAWLAGYTGEITDDQVIFEGANGVVDHRQLAMSGLRAEDLHWLLDLDPKDEDTLANAIEGYIAHGWKMEGHDYWFDTLGFRAGDRRTWNELTDPDYRLANGVANLLVTYDKAENKQYFYPDSVSEEVVQKMTEMAKNGFAENRTDADEWPYNHSSFETRGQIKANGYHHYLQIAAEFYQESIADADIISLSLGNTNFGTWMFDYMQDVFANENQTNFLDRYFTQDIYDYYMEGFDEELKAEIVEFMGIIDPIIDANFDVETFGELRAQKFKYIIKHCVLSYVVNYVACVEHIVELNPDVQIIQVSLMNAYASKSETSDNEESFSDVIDILYGPLNAFIAAVPSFLRATDSEKYKDAAFYFADMTSVETVSDVYGDDFYLDAENNPMEYPGLNTKDVAGHRIDTVVRERFHHWIASADISTEYIRDANPSYGEIWKHLLKHINNGTIFGYGIRMVSLQNVRDYELMTDEEITEVMNSNDQKQKDLLFSCAVYRAFENAIIEAGRSEFTLEGLGSFSGINVDAFSDAMSEFYIAMDAESSTTALALQSAEDLRNMSKKLNDALMADEGVVTILCLANRMEIGSGIGGHPSNGGHDNMFEIIKASYMEYTSEDELASVTGNTGLDKIYFALLRNEYLTMTETLELVNGLAERIDFASLGEAELTQDDISCAIEYVYGYLLEKNVDADDRIDIIKIVYANLSGDIIDEYSPALDTVGSIYAGLYDAELITNAEAFGIVDFVYGRVVDLEIDDDDAYAIISYVYRTLFSTDKTVEEKIEILNIVFEELGDSAFADEISSVRLVVNLYGELKADENISDEAIVILVDMLFEAIAEKSENGEQIDMEALISEVAEEFITNEELDIVTKAAIADKLISTSDNGEIPELTKIAAVLDSLKESGYIDEADINSVLEKTMDMIEGGELDGGDGVKLFLYAYDLVLADLSLTEKGEFALDLYEEIREAYGMSHGETIITAVKLAYKYTDDVCEGVVDYVKNDLVPELTDKAIDLIFDALNDACTSIVDGIYDAI